MVDLHLPGPSGATLRVWPGGTRSLRLSWPTGQLPSGTWRLVAAGLDLTGTVDGDVVSWALTVDQVRAVLGQRWAVWCSTATDHPVLAGQVLEQRPLPGAGDGVTVEVAVVDGDPVVVEVGGPGGGMSEVEVQALIDAALAGLDPGVVLSDATPQAPGAAGPGVSVEASRADHRHAPPTAGQIGAATPADIEAAIDALPGPPTAVFAVADLDMSGGSWTELPGIGLPRMFLVGLPVLVLTGADAGLWVVTASGPCTPLPDPGGAVIAVTAQQTVASPIVDQMVQPAGWALVPNAETVSQRQPLDSDLTAIAALATTSWGRALLTLADAAAARAVLDAAATGHVHDASAITTGVVAAARLGSGTASVGTFLTGAGTWAPRGYRLLAGQPYDGAATKSGTGVTTQNRVAWTTLEGLALGAQVDALWVDVTTGGSTGATVQLSLLADDGYGRPGALLAQTAQLPAETSTAIVMGTFTAVTLTTSTIHIGVHVRSTAQPTLRAISSRATCIPSGGTSTSNTMAWSSTIAGVAVGSNPAVDVSSAACYRAGIRGA